MYNISLVEKPYKDSFRSSYSRRENFAGCKI